MKTTLGICLVICLLCSRSVGQTEIRPNSVDTNLILTAPESNTLVNVGFRNEKKGEFRNDKISLRDLKNLLHFEKKDMKRVPSSSAAGGMYTIDLKNAWCLIELIESKPRMTNDNRFVSALINFNPVVPPKGVLKSVTIGDGGKPSVRYEEESPTNSPSIK